MIIVPILTSSLIHFSLKGWENVLFELGSESVNEAWWSYNTEYYRCQFFLRQTFIHPSLLYEFANIKRHFVICCRVKNILTLLIHYYSRFCFTLWVENMAGIISGVLEQDSQLSRHSISPLTRAL